MALPPELFDEVIFHLRHDKPTLLNCSLVAKSWVYWSQKLLHDWHLRFTPETFRTWQETASLSSIESLQYVRSLTCSRFPIDDFHEDHLKSFHRLQHITLHRVTSIRPDLTNLFPASQNTLSSLHLSLLSIHRTVIANIIDCFPNLRELHIDRSRISYGPMNTPFPSRSPRGKLRLTGLLAADMGSLCACLCGLDLGYDELEIVNPPSRPNSFVPPIVHACGEALERLKFSPSSSLLHLTLENCSGLRELVCFAHPTGPKSIELSLISSITSTNLRKIAFVPHSWGDGWNQIHWISLDTTMSDLVDRLRAWGYEHTLELQFQLEPKSAGVYPTVGLDAFFPRFMEKGRVTLLDPTNGRTFYQSDE